MRNEEFDDKKIMGTFIGAIISVFKWLCLILFVLNIGLTIGFIIMSIMKGSNMSNDLIVTMMRYISYLNEAQILGYISRIGKVRVIVAGIGYGVATSISYGLAYNIVGKFQKIFKSIIPGEMYTKENVKTLNEALPLTCILAFAQPVIIYVIVETIHIFQLSDINVSGIAFIIATYIMKLTFEKGYELAEANIIYDKKLSDIKAKESEAKIAEIKKQLAEKKNNKALQEKKDAEKTVSENKEDIKDNKKKSTAKTEEKKASTSKTKKTTAKKATKKTTTK